MSRLHECKAKGLDKVKSTPHWGGIYATLGDRMSELYLKAVESPRAGTRNNKTRKKTAQVFGHGIALASWKERNSGIISAKSRRIKDAGKMKKMIAEKAKGDVKG